MKRPWILLCSVPVLVLAGCSSTKYNADWKRDVSFANLQTYSWAERPQEPVPDTRRARRQAEREAEIERRLVAVVDRELSAKGYELVSNDPDFHMAYFAAGRDTVSVTTVVDYWGYATPWILVTGDTRYYTKGALVLGVIDPNNDEVIWHGWVTAEIDDPALDAVEKKINQVVPKLLSRFPPKQ